MYYNYENITFEHVGGIMNILAKKNIISLFLILFMCFLSTISVSANTNLQLGNIDMSKINYELAKNTTVNFKKISNSEVIYTYSENGKTFKNIDKILSANKIYTSVFEVTKNGDSYLHSFESIVENSSITTFSDSGKKLNSMYVEKTASGYNWKYQSSYNGNTSFRNMTITAIAIALGAAISGPVGVFMAVAGYLYDKNVKTVYYHVNLYKDLNSSPHRPAFKKVAYFYKDKSHSHAIPGNPVVFIVKP